MKRSGRKKLNGLLVFAVIVFVVIVFSFTNPQLSSQIYNSRTVTVSEVLLQQNRDCNELILAASKGDSSITDEKLNECDKIEQDLFEQTQSQIEQELNTINDNTTTSQTAPISTTTEDPFTKFCNENPIFIICSKTKSLELVTSVLKFDSSGKLVTEEKRSPIPQLAFLGDDANIDYRSGSLAFSLLIKGDPNTDYNGLAKVDLMVGDQSLFTTPIEFSFKGKTDKDGTLKSLITNQGAERDLLQFKFADNFNRFPNEKTTQVKLHVTKLDVTGERDQKFSLVNSDVYSLNISRDDIKILITGSSGEVSRVYPTDSKLVLTTVQGKSLPYSGAYTSRVVTYDSAFQGNGRGCAVFKKISNISYPQPATKTATYPVPPPTITGITVLDSDGKTVASSSGGTGKILDTLLTRNDNYTVKVSSLGLTSADLVYGKSQETKSFTFSQTGTVKMSSSSTRSGSTAPCGTYYITTVTRASGVTLGEITYNIPKRQ